MENERVLRVEPKHFFDADFVVVEVGDLRFVTKGPGLRTCHGFWLLFLEQRKRLRLVQQGQQPRGRELRRGLNRFHRCTLFQVERENRRVALNQLET